MTYTPRKGDIVHIDFNPSVGKEMKDPHPALVISEEAFNKHFDMATVCPITSGSGQQAMSVLISEREGLKIKGNILAYQFKTLDTLERDIKFIERCPDHIFKEVERNIRMALALP